MTNAPYDREGRPVESKLLTGCLDEARRSGRTRGCCRRGSGGRRTRLALVVVRVDHDAG